MRHYTREIMDMPGGNLLRHEDIYINSSFILPILYIDSIHKIVNIMM